MVVALGLRLWGISFGLPAVYRPDEDVVVGRAMGVLHGVFDPHFADWPHLYFYVSAGWLAFLHPLLSHLGPAAPYLAVRLLDALLGTATVLLVYRLGARAYGRAVGLVGSLALAVAFLHVRDSHFATTDIPLTLAVTAAVYAAVRLSERGYRRTGLLAGVALGIAAGVKYNGALSFAGMAAAVLQRCANAAHALRQAGGRLIAIALAGLATLLVTSPFLVIHFGLFRIGLSHIFQHLLSPSLSEIGWVHVPRVALWSGLDPPLFLLSLAGIVYAGIRRTAADWIFGTFLLAYYGLMGAGYSVFVRYADPMVPVLLLLGARFLVEITTRWRWPALGLGAGVAMVTLPALVHDIAFDSLMLRTDTRSQAFDWLASNVPAGARVAELYFAAPAHDQAMVDDRRHAHGATDPYVASFLQNRLEDRYSVHDLTDEEIDSDSLTALKADGVSYVVFSAPTPGTGCERQPPLGQALEATGPPLVTFKPTVGCPDSVFDTIDAFYVPLAGYAGWQRPGPLIQIYQVR